MFRRRPSPRIAPLIVLLLLAPAFAAGEPAKGDAPHPDLLRIAAGATRQFLAVIERVGADAAAECADFRARILPAHRDLLARMDRFVTEAGERKAAADAKEKERAKVANLAASRRDELLARLDAAVADYGALLRRQAVAFPAGYEVFLESVVGSATDPVRLAAPRVREAVERRFAELVDEIRPAAKEDAPDR